MSNPFEQFMQQAKTFQESLKKFQTELKTIQVTGEAGAGMVKVIMDGHYQTQGIEIDDEVYTEGKAMLISLIIAANNDAANKVKQAMKEKMGSLSTGMGLPANFPFPFI
jgi:hypothetical protein